MSELLQWLKEKKHKKSPWGEKLDRNGYAKSMLSIHEDECFRCGAHGDLARHEIFYGTADRPTSKATGMWVYLCPKCHESVHRNSRYMHKVGQGMFEFYHSHEEFMELFGKNYL